MTELDKNGTRYLKRKKSRQDKAPEFTDTLTSATLTEKDRLVLRCNVTGSPDPNVDWDRNGQKIGDDDEGVTIKNRAGLCSLSIAEVRLADSGTFTCKATNSEGQAQTEATVDVKSKTPILKAAPTDLPRFIRHPQGVSVTDGDDAVVECEVPGDIEITWYKGNDVIQDNDDFRYETIGAVRRLVIAEVFPEDSGVYKVEASNSTGSSTSFFTIYVNIPEEEPSGPVFQTYPQSQNVDEGCSVKFQCRLDQCNTVTWMQGNRVLDATGRFKITTTENGSEFEIPAAIATDSGSYSVEANNDRGNALWTFTLHVNVSSSPCADVDVLSLISAAHS